MESTFTSNHLRVELILITDAGRSTLPAHLSDLLLEKSVVIFFTVQHAQMAELYDFIREVWITELNRRLEHLRYGSRFYARRRGGCLSSKTRYSAARFAESWLSQASTCSGLKLMIARS